MQKEGEVRGYRVGVLAVVALAALIALLLFVMWAVIVGGLGTGIGAPAVGTARPAADRDEALGRLKTAQARSCDVTAGPCVTALYEPDPETRVPGTYVLIHGFTNCPAQFADVATVMAKRGCTVLVPRMPRHGRNDTLTHDLAEITEAEITDFVQESIDIAAGLGGPVSVVGLSAGANAAAWAAAFRPEVERLALIAPFVAPKAFPMFAVRLLIRFKAVLPKMWIWWDPRKKADLGESPYVYPGFHLPAMVPFLHVTEALYDSRIEPTNRLKRVVLLTNPGDFAIRHDVARTFVNRAFTGHSDVVAEAELDGSLGWWHDFVDPHSPHGGSAEQVEAVVRALLGDGEDASAGGLLTIPAPTRTGASA